MIRTKRGFTLLEVIIALLILSSGIVLLTSTWGGTNLRLRKTQLNTVIAALLERKMAEIEMKYRGKPLASIPDKEGEDFGDDYKEYSWTLESREFELPDFTEALISRDGGVKQEELTLMKLFEDHLSKSVKEVKVTIIYTHNGKKLEYSATSLFIDFDRPLPIPGA